LVEIQDVSVKEQGVPRIIELDLEDPEVLVILKALASETRWNIIKNFGQKTDVCEIARKINQTEANISAQIKILEKAHLVTPKFEIGRHGVKKICELNADRIIINI